MTAKYRIAANEFAANYRAGTKEAKLAYRQLNYYYFEKGKEKIYMGDFMLNFPETDDDFVDILLKGNLFVLNNIRSLLAMGTGEPGVSLADKVAQLSKDESIYTKIEYHNDAKSIYEIILNAKSRIEATNRSIEELDNDSTISKEERVETVEILLSSIQNLAVFRSLIESYAYGDSTYGEYLEANNYVTDYSVFYPIVEAMTPGQRVLLEFGQLSEIVIYDTVRKSDEDLEDELKKVEEEFGETSVFHGTDLEAFKGSFAITNDALRIEAATGESWMDASDAESQKLMGFTLLGIGGATTTAVSAILLKEAISSYTALHPDYVALLDSMESLGSQITAAQRTVQFLAQQTEFASSKGLATEAIMRGAKRQLQTAMENYTNSSIMLKSCPMHLSNRSIWPIVGSSVGVALGLIMIGFSISNIVKILNSYKVEYTDIPLNMINCVNTDNGNRFVRYRVVNSYFENDGKTDTRPGDTNGYNGKQWVALYYTKSYEAGKCLLAKYDLPKNESDIGKYTPVHEFGKLTTCCNLNTYSDYTNAEKVFLAFQNSNAKKAAETDVPTIVGSIINYGTMTLSAAVGFGIGVGTMVLINKRKKEKIKISET
jgi:hypothetical protein